MKHRNKYDIKTMLEREMNTVWIEQIALIILGGPLSEEEKFLIDLKAQKLHTYIFFFFLDLAFFIERIL